MSLVAVAEGDYVTVPLEPEDEPAVDLTPEQRDRLIAKEYRGEDAGGGQDFRIRESGAVPGPCESVKSRLHL